MRDPESESLGQRLGVFGKCMLVCVAGAVLSLIAVFVILTLRAPRFGFNINPPWFETALDALKVISGTFLLGGVAFKGLFKMFQR